MEHFSRENEGSLKMELRQLQQLVEKVVGPCSLREGTTGIYYYVVHYDLDNKRKLEEIAKSAEDVYEWRLLYHVALSRMTEYGHSCIFYTKPSFGWLVSLTLESEDSGLVEKGTAVVYESSEQFHSELDNKLKIILTSDVVFGQVSQNVLFTDFSVQ